MVDFESIRNSLNGVLSDLDTEITKLRRGRSTNFDEVKTLLGEFENVLMSDKQLRKARIGDIDGVNPDEVYQFIEQYQQILRDKIARYKESLGETDVKRTQLDTLVKDEIDDKDIAKSQRNIKEFNEDTTMVSGTMAERQTAAATKKAELTQRIAVAKKLDETIKSTTPPITKDDIVDSIKYANSDMKKVTKKMNDSEHLMDENSLDLLMQEIEMTARRVENHKKSDYTAEDYQKIQLLLDELEKYNTPKCLALKAKIEGVVQKNSDGKVEKVTDVVKLKSDTKQARKGPAAIDVAEEKKENQKLTSAHVRADLLDLLNNKGIFKFYANETKGFEKEINDPTTTLERIKEIKGIMQNLIDQAIDQDLESQLDQAETDRADISALEAQKLRAELTESKLNDVSRKHNTLSTTKRNLFGVELQLLDEHSRPKDISQIAGTDQELEKMYDDLEKKLGEEKIKEVFDANAPAVYKPNLLQRAFWKLTHPSSWGKKYGLAEIRMDQWVKEEIGRSVAEIKSDATDKAWTIQPDELKGIQDRSKDIAENARKKQRAAIIDGKKDARTASKDAKTEIDQEQENEDMIL